MLKEVLNYVAFLLIVVMMGIGTFRKLVAARNSTCNAFGQIDVHLKRRHDLIMNLVEVSKRYVGHESPTTESVVDALGEANQAATQVRANPANPQAMALLSKTEVTLTGAFGCLMAALKKHRDFKDDATMSSLTNEIDSAENSMRLARQRYNDGVVNFHYLAKQFPNVLISHAMSLHQLPMFQATAEHGDANVRKLAY